MQKSQIRTHYQNLQVLERADPAVIKASYKALSQRYHPDRNPDNLEESARIFRIITEAYEVLSDPDRRREYDTVICAKRSGETKPSTESESVRDSDMDTGGTPKTSGRSLARLLAHLNGLGTHPRTPGVLRWFLSPPWRLLLLLQLVAAGYLFREILP